MPNVNGKTFDYSPKGMALAKKEEMKMKSMIPMKEGGDNTAFAKLAPPYDKATYADKIAGATKKAKKGYEMPSYKKRGEVKTKKY